MVASFVKGYQRQNMCKLREKCLSITTDRRFELGITAIIGSSGKRSDNDNLLNVTSL